MKRVLVLLLAVGTSVNVASQNSPPSTERGLVIESFEKDSVLERAGLRVGDELVGWVRSDSGSQSVAVRGAFATPFDAREFEIEELPRGGTSVTFRRAGAASTAALRAGFWGVRVRPAFLATDLDLYSAGAALEGAQPLDALAKWQPLIDRLSSNDPPTAAWLLCRVGSALVVTDALDRAGEVFDQAAALVASSRGRAFDAMVWEAKGRAFLPETPPPAAKVSPARLRAALEAHQRASESRKRTGLLLAAAESDLLRGAGAVWGVQVRIFPDAPDGQNPEFQPAGALLKSAVDVIDAQAPVSFAHVRAVERYSIFVFLNWGPRSLGKLERADAVTDRRRLLKEVRPVLETLAPASQLMRAVLQALGSGPGPDEQRNRESEEVFRRLIQWANVNNDSGQLPLYTRTLVSLLAARGSLEEALAFADDKPGGVSKAQVVLSVAQGLVARGEIERAMAILEGQLRQQNLAPDVLFNTADVLHRLQLERGNLAAAERSLTTVLDTLGDQLQPKDRALVLYQLARISDSRGELVSAEALARQALVAWDAIPPPAKFEDAQRARVYDFLSSVAFQNGDIDQGKAYLQTAIKLGEAGAQQSRALQGDQANRRSRLSENHADALTWSLEELRFARETLPGTSSEAMALHNVAIGHLYQGAYGEAIGYLKNELAIERRLDASSGDVASTLALLGKALAETGQQEAALTHFNEALAVLTGRRLSSSAEASPEEYGAYVLAADALTKAGQNERAFEVVEGSRAHALLQLITTRDLRNNDRLPLPIRVERRRLEMEDAQKQAQLAQLSTSQDDAAIDALHVERKQIQLKLADLNQKVVEADPRFASLTQPKPLTLAAARLGLDAGTVALSYLVGDDFTLLFVISSAADADAKPLVVQRIPVGVAELHDLVGAFNRLIEWDMDPSMKDREKLVAGGRRLYDLLLRPVEAQINRARRVVLSLDGPLHGLPFNALVRNRTGAPEYVLPWKPFHTTPSLAAYADTIAARSTAPAAPTLVAFADPKYPASGTSLADAEATVVMRSTTLAPLLNSRREVQAIAAPFGDRAKVYYGEDATEERFKAIGESATFIHIAAHGILNEHLPLDSAVALTIPTSPVSGGDNGFVQAWEILSSVRIKAELVTLSACDSALGKEVAGEGLMGLTRAFLIAGARSVVASLWKVADGPTADLMIEFYKNLGKGQTKDEALRNAQLFILGKGKPAGSKIDYSSPAHWAAFTLTGDWK